MYYYYHGIKARHPLPPLHHISICTVFQFLYIPQFLTIYMYIPNFIKPAWHNCINESMWQTFFCKN